MPKNHKPEANEPAAPAEEITPVAAPAAKKQARSSKTTARKKTAAKKSTTAPKTAAKKKSPTSRTTKAEPYEPSEAEVRLRAYFIAERRAQLSIEGDPSNDWLEARQQLLDEAANRS